MTTDMNTENDHEPPVEENTTNDPMAAWAEALQEQHTAKETIVEAEQGGPLEDTVVDESTVQAEGSGQDISRVLDIPVQLSVELGRTKVPIKYILQLAQGSVVELDALAGEPMDVLVNGYLIAQGEVVVVNDKFGIRLTDVVTPSERLRRVSRGG